MKKIFMMSIASFLLGIIFLMQPVEVRAEDYFWAESRDTGEAGWYMYARPTNGKSVKLDSAPEIVDGDSIIIDCALDEAGLQMLKNLSNVRCDVSSFWQDGNIQIGNPNSEGNLVIDTLNAYYGNITAYANVSHMRVERSNVTVCGSVDLISLGDTQSNVGSGTINITGDVRYINWYKKELRPDVESEDTYYVGFDGTVNVGGSVDEGAIYSVVYDEVIDKGTWQLTGEIGACDTGMFQIESGVLSESVPVTEITPSLGNYVFSYGGYGYSDSDKTRWTKEAINAETGAHAYFEDCEFSDIPENASVTLYGTSPKDPVVFDMNLSELFIHSESDVNVTINGNVDLFVYYTYAATGCTATINGDVNEMMFFYEYNPDYNITITGNVKSGEVFGDVNGWFGCSNMQIVKAGDLNPSLFVQTKQEEGSLAYNPVQQKAIEEALVDNGVGQEVTVSTPDGDKTLIKTGEVLVSETTRFELEQLKQSDAMKNALLELERMLEQSGSNCEITLDCAVDINVNTYYKDKETGEEYSDDAYGTEAVTELGEGKSLTFTVKIPADLYDANALYYIIRKHMSADGTALMTILDATRDNDILTFASDMFSTFAIVKAEVDGIPVRDGLLQAEDGKYYYYVDGVVDTTKNGLILCGDNFYYFEDGQWISDKYDLVKLGEGTFFVVNGVVANNISGLQLIGDNFYFLAYGQLQDQYTGLALYDNEWFYVVNGVLAIDFNGILAYDGSLFLIAAGRIVGDYVGLYGDEATGTWYYIVYGQVQTLYTGLIAYDGAWFYFVNGVLASDFTGTVEYDGAQFEVVNGGVVFNE